MNWSAHISTLFHEHPYRARVAQAAAAGFTHVETWWPTPENVEPLVAEVAAHGVRVAAINAHGGDLAAGERGFLNDPGRRAQADDAFADALALAERLGADKVHVLAGRALPGVGRRRQDDQVRGVLREWAGHAERAGVTLLVEAINELDVPGYLVPTTGRALELLEAVGSDAVRLMLDAYHVARAGDDPIAAVTACREAIGHVQFADHPGRGGPGSGAIDLPALVAALDRNGYDGCIGLEYNPAVPTLASLAALPAVAGIDPIAPGADAASSPP